MKKKAAKQNMIQVVVLNDGETFTDLQGCRLVSMTEKKYLELAKEDAVDEYIEDSFADSPLLTDLLKS